MSQLRHIVLLTLCLCTTLLWGQRRYMMSERWEHRLEELSEFSSKDVSDKTDAFWGLHTTQYAGSHHLLGFSLEGSWSTFVHNVPTASIIPGGGAVGLHFIYEYQYSGLLFQTGLGINYQRVFTHVADTNIYQYDMRDHWDRVNEATFTLKHNFRDRCDMSQQLYGQVPLYVGHYILGPTGIGYYLAGIHVNYAFWGNTSQTMTGTTTGMYEKYVGIWEEMDNHGFRKDVPVERTGKQLQLKLDLMAHGEIGYEYTTYQGPHNYRITTVNRLDLRMRFAAFVDFGILNINPQTKNSLYTLPEETIYDFPTYKMDHIFSTEDVRSFWMRNMYAGVRFTLLFGFQNKEHCILCDSWRH